MRKTITQWFVGVVVSLCCVSSMSAQQAAIFPFLRSLTSGRTAALGGATVALTDDAANLVVNPAVLGTVDTVEVHATFIKHVLDINAGFASYVTDIGESGTGAVTIGYMDYGQFTRSTADGSKIGSFGGNDLSIGVSYGNELDTLITYGVTAKILHSSLTDIRSTAIALDGGMLFRFPAKRTNVGISILNLGTQLSTYDGTHDRLPLDMRIGLNHRLRGLPLMINASFNHLTDDVPGFLDRFANFSLGGEFYIGKYVQARFAYDNAVRNTSAVSIATQLSGFSAGIGILTKVIKFDYALNILGASAVLHRVTISSAL